jgi:1-deoxy-D-xylulose-5-phosphate synthase
MSIDRNVGGMASHLRRLRTKERYLGMKNRSKNFLAKIPGGNLVARGIRKTKDKLRRMLIPATFFETIGFTYLEPVDGHDTEHLIYLLREAKRMRRPVVLHVITEKGRGYAPAQDHPEAFHGVGRFDPETGKAIASKNLTFSDSLGTTLCKLAEENERLCAVTAAIPSGTGLSELKQKFPKRVFDVGIAEEHAVSMAGGLAKQGMIPVVAIYSTFLQRAYDMILQDICLQKLHVVLAVDRAGLVGEDGETHHGVFDVGFLRQAPGMRILCPACRQELADMLQLAVNDQSGPVAIRYPRGGDGAYSVSAADRSVDVCRQGTDITILTYGTTINDVLCAGDILAEKGISATILRLTSVAPLPVQEITAALTGKHCIVVEECCTDSGIRQALALELSGQVSVTGIDLGHDYVTHGALNVLRDKCGLSAIKISDFVKKVYDNEN